MRQGHEMKEPPTITNDDQLIEMDDETFYKRLRGE